MRGEGKGGGDTPDQCGVSEEIPPERGRSGGRRDVLAQGNVAAVEFQGRNERGKGKERAL